VLEYHLIDPKNNKPEQTKNSVGFVFKLTVIVTWILLLLPLYPLFTYTSTNVSLWQQYSTQYFSGLVIYISICFFWLVLLSLPEQSVKWVSQRFEDLNSQLILRVQFVSVCAFLTLLILTIMRLYGWGYNSLLQLGVLLLGLWLSFLPMFWEWGLKGWPFRGISPGWLYDWLTQNLHRWLPPLVAVGILLVSNVLGSSASPRLFMLALGPIPAIVGLLIFLRWPPLGFVVLVITALIVPSPSLPGGLNLAVILLIVLIGLQLLVTIVHRRPMRLVPSRTVRPLLALSAVAILAFGVGQLRWFIFAEPAPLDAQLGGLAIFILAMGIFLLTAHQIRDLRWLQWVTWIFVGITAIEVVRWLLPPFRSLTEGIFSNGTTNNAMFWLWLVALTFSQAVYNQKLHIGWRVVLGGVALATLYAATILNNDWKSGYLPTLVCVGVLIGFRSWRTVLVLAMIGYPVAIYLSSQAIASDDYSYSTRVDALLIMLKIIQVNPIIGFGPANYYYYTSLFPIRGYAVAFNSHNQYIDIAAQTGLLGLACYFWFFGEAGWLAWQLRNRVPAGFAQAYVYGVLGGLAGMLAAGMLVDWVLPFAYNIGLTGFRTSMLAWMFLGGLVCLEQIYRHQSPSAKSAIGLRV
jgi:hypothetical protein